jgi:hypothetical protein
VIIIVLTWGKVGLPSRKHNASVTRSGVLKELQSVPEGKLGANAINSLPSNAVDFDDISRIYSGG